MTAIIVDRDGVRGRARGRLTRCCTAPPSAPGTASRYLWSGQFRTLASVAEALYWARIAGGRSDDLTPDEVAENVDRYLPALRRAAQVGDPAGAHAASTSTRSLFLHPPFTLMARRRAPAVPRAALPGDVARRRIGSLRRWLVQGMIRIAQQMVYLGYYGDPRQPGRRCGYMPFSQRPGDDPSLRKPRAGCVVEAGAEAARATSRGRGGDRRLGRRRGRDRATGWRRTGTGW